MRTSSCKIFQVITLLTSVLLVSCDRMAYRTSMDWGVRPQSLSKTFGSIQGNELIRIDISTLNSQVSASSVRSVRGSVPTRERKVRNTDVPKQTSYVDSFSFEVDRVYFGELEALEMYPDPDFPQYIYVRTPPQAAGLVDVVLQNTLSKEVFLPMQFKYVHPPELYGMVVSAGSLGGGTLVTVLVRYLEEQATVVFDSSSPSPCIVEQIKVAAGEIVCRTPAHVAGLVDIVVTNSVTGYSSIPYPGYRYQLAPVVSSILPVRGNEGGGYEVVVSGSHFLPGASVFFGALEASVVGIQVSSILVNVPNVERGVLPILVRNPDGQEGYLNDAFRVDGPPIIFTVNPGWGNTLGGQLISISGMYFDPGGVEVFIGAAPCSVLSVTETEVLCTTPALGVGKYSVLVKNPISQLSGSRLDAFEVVLPPPSVLSISPTQGPVYGGTDIVLSGNYFDSGSVVTIGGFPCSEVSRVSTSLTCKTGNMLTPGNKTVSVTNLRGEVGTSAIPFTALDSVIDGMNPNEVVEDTGGYSFTVSGSNFPSDPSLFQSVQIGGKPCASIAPISPTTFSCTVPDGLPAGSHSATIQFSSGYLVSLVNAVSAVIRPEIPSVAPRQGSALGGNTVRLSGKGLNHLGAFFFGTQAATIVLRDSGGSWIDVIVPAAATPGTTETVLGRSATVREPNGLWVTAIGLENYKYDLLPPEFSAFNPPQGSKDGGTSIQVAGSNFQPGVTVQLCGTTVLGFSVLPTSFSFTLPTCPSIGAQAVIITNPDDQFVNGTSFMYLSSPFVSSLSPTNGTQSGGTTVQVSGTGFDSGLTVTVCGQNTTVNFTDSTSFSFITPFCASAGQATVTIRNPDGQTASPAFNYNDPCVGDGLITFEKLPITGQEPNQLPNWDGPGDYVEMGISEYENTHGVRFCRLFLDPASVSNPFDCATSSGSPIGVSIGSVEGTRTGWTYDYTVGSEIYDQLVPADRPIMESYFITGNQNVGALDGILIAYDTAVAEASGYIMDIDSGTEIYDVNAYDENKVLVTNIQVAFNDGGTGNGRATKWEIDNGGMASIRYITIDPIAGGGFGIDRFSPTSTCQ